MSKAFIKYKFIILFCLIVALSLIFRINGANWDQGHHLHPDERFLTMVALDIRWPENLFDYFNTQVSSLNPHNVGYNFYVYGTYPIILTKALAEVFNKYDYKNLTLLGRQLAVLFEIGTTILVMLIAQKLTKKKFAGLMAGFFYATSALPIQQSHFFTVDPFMVFFMTLGIFLAVIGKLTLSFGIAAGLAVSSKISGALVLPYMLMITIYTFFKSKNKKYVLFSILMGIILFLVIIRLFYPYLFNGSFPFSWKINPQTVNNFKELKSYSSPTLFFPPAIQWFKTQVILFPLSHIALVGMGLPHFLAFLAGIYFIFKSCHKKAIILLAGFVLFIFIYQGIQYAKAMRYFYPIYPAVAVVASYSLSKLKNKKLLLMLTLIALLLWPVMQISIYTSSHTRTQASEWIYDNIEKNQVRAVEHWDDALPFTIDKNIPDIYPSRDLEIFTPDNVDKWDKIESQLEESDFIVLSSNRGYGALTSMKDKWPETHNYYQKLFNNNSEFKLSAQFTSRPNLPMPMLNICIRLPFFSYGKIAQIVEECSGPGITIIDDYTDETWTVYDHPKVLIFSKK